MTDKLPKVRRRSSRQTVLAVMLTVFALLLVGAVGLLLSSDGIFSDEPRTDAERDYELLLDGLRREPKNPAVLMSLAEAEYELGKHSDAFQHAQAAVEFAEKEPGYRLRYATLLVRSERIEQARDVVQAELDLGTTDDPEPYFLMAQIERALDNLEAAENNIERAIEINPTSADFLIVYGGILEDANRKDEAVRAYSAALRFIPDDQRALDGLKRLGAEPPKSTESTSPHGDSAPE